MTAHHPQDDDWLDAELRRVAVPATLTDRLLQIAQDDLAQLDERLRDVPVPDGLRIRLLRIARPPRWSVRQVAMAATVLIGVSLWYGAAVITLVSARYATDVPPLAPPLDLVLTEPYPQISESGWTVESPLADDAQWAPSEIDPRVDFWDTWLATNRQSIRAAMERYAPSAAPWWNDELDPIRLARGPMANQSQILGNVPTTSDLPPVAPLAPWPEPRGFEMPLEVSGRLFLLEHGVFPPVRTKTRSETAVPLTAVGGNLDQPSKTLAANQWPEAGTLRTEQFAAAVSTGPEVPENRSLELTTQLGPCRWSRWSADPAVAPTEAPLQMLHVAIAARSLPPSTRSAVSLTVLVDVSPSMAFPGRLDSAREGLLSLLAHLQPGDTVRLLSFHRGVTTWIEDATLQDRAALEAAVRGLTAEPASTEPSNLTAGLLAACAAAAADAQVLDQPARVVLLSDGPTTISASIRRQIEQLWSSLPKRRVRLDVIELTPRSELEPEVERLVELNSGRRHATTDARLVGWALSESLTDRNWRVADRVRLTITFNPKTVTAWRIIGHEPNALAELMEVPLEIDLYSGDAATALVEVQLAAGREPEIAQVRLDWQTPRGVARQVVRRVTRSQVAADFASAPAGWQTASLAAATGEWLRQSPLVQHITPGDLLAALRNVEPSERSRGVVKQLEHLLDQAERLRVRRPPPSP